MGGIHTVGDALLNSPQDGINVEAVLGNVGEGILTGGIAAGAGGALPVMAQSGGLVSGVALAAGTGVGLRAATVTRSIAIICPSNGIQRAW